MTEGDRTPEAVAAVPGEGALRWAVIVPVKAAAFGKSRLDVPGTDRAALARAIALDTIAAAASCGLVERVFVVTDDGGLVLHATDIPGLRFVPEVDPGGLDALVARGAVTPARSRLDAAIARGIETAGERMPRAALLGDVPALRPGDLADALREAASVDRAVVPDAEGTGSTLVTARAGVTWESAFGDGSFARHIALGCVPLPVGVASTLRRDVDTADQLAAASALGLGPRTRAVLSPGAAGVAGASSAAGDRESTR